MKNVAIVEALWAGHSPNFVQTFVEIVSELGHRPIVLCPDPVDARRRLSVPCYPLSVQSLTFSPGGVRRALRTADLWRQVGNVLRRQRLSIDLILFSLVDHFTARFLSAQAAQKLVNDVPYAGLLFGAPWLKDAQHRDEYGARHATLLGASVLATLDEEVEEVLRNATRRPVIYIPDGFEKVSGLAPLPSSLPKSKIEVGVFGAIGKRKRILELAHFIRESDRSRYSFSIVGRLDLSPYAAADQMLIKNALQQVNVNLIDRFVSDVEMDRAMASVDVVWLAYDAHHASSGIMARAARLGRTVLTTDGTLLARRCKHYSLGGSISRFDVASISRALTDAVANASDAGKARYASEFSEEAAHRSLRHFIEEALKAA